jgi:hypothetical protein
VHLIPDPLIAVFGEKGDTALLESPLIANEDLVLANYNGHSGQEVIQHQGALHDWGMADVPEKRLGNDLHALSVDTAITIQEVFAQDFDVVLHNYTTAPLLVILATIGI